MNNQEIKDRYDDVEFVIESLSTNEKIKNKQIEKMIEKRNEILLSMGIDISNRDNKSNEKNINSDNDYLRQRRNLNKFEDSLLGFATADAMGVPIEFVDRNILQKNPLTEMVGYGSHKVSEGTWSDDKSMTIATIDSIIEKRTINYDDIMNKFTEWYKNAKYTATDKLFDIGISTSEAINNYLYYNIESVKCGGTNIRSNGNGSLMRMLPIAFYLYNSNFTESEEVEIVNNMSSLTHGHEISKLGCKIYIDYIKLLLDGNSKEQAFELLKQYSYEKYYNLSTLKEYNRILTGSLKKCQKEEINSSGYIVDTLEACLWCTLNSNNYEEAVVQAINLGNDTDTIGAITGSINGILYGKENIPARWLGKLKKKEYLINLSREFDFVMLNKINEKEKKIN